MANLLYPLSVKMRAGASKRVRFGYPWVFANEIEMTPEAKAMPSGSMVRLIDDNGAFLGVGSFNPHSLICFRKFSTEADIPINSAFIAKRLRKCLDLRHKLIGSTYYRLVHSEGDNLPGVVIDRFGDVVSCQLNTAGADLLRKDIVAALKEVLDPKTILFRSESSARALEGLEPLNEIEFGEIPSPLEVKENGIKFLIDIREGQKTGWFYDQRDNRAFAGRLAHGLRFADFYTYAGGFALHAAIAGAKEVLACDRSADSLALAEQSAALNKVADKSRFVKSMVPKRVGACPSSDSVYRLVRETCVAEIVHFALCILAFPIYFFWNNFVGVILTLVFVICNIPFMMIQRYNRPVLVSLAQRLEKREERRRNAGTHSVG